jgi:hypothetical protein
MNENTFLQSYLKPSTDQLNREFTHPLPPIAGLQKRGDLIVQGTFENTFSTNIISKYESAESGIRLIDVYKCTQHTQEGQFVRLVGTMSLVKSGYPFLFLDAAVSNISPFTQQREDLITRVLIHFPQARPEQRDLVFAKLRAAAEKAGANNKEVSIPGMPPFWGALFLADAKPFAPKLIETIRNAAGEAYSAMIKETKSDSAIDYMPVKEQMIFNTSKREFGLFSKMGLSVPLEAQAAFFTAMTVGVDNPA